MARVQLLTRIESLINVGCKFGPNDLDVELWDGLIAMALERQFVDKLVQVRRDKKDKHETEVAKARDAAGTPAPGQTIFPPTRPFT